jgi:hypothetical protein
MVPLYGKIYAEFSDSRLPDDVGLEARLQQFGVTPEPDEPRTAGLRTFGRTGWLL